MRQSVLRLCALTAVLLLPLGVPPTAAQEEAPQLPPGVALEALARLASVELPKAATLDVFRLALEPGAEIPVHPHPGMEIAVFEEGSGSMHTAEGPAVQLIRAGVAEAMPEAYGVGEELMLTVGDIVIVPAGNFSNARAGNQGATVLVFELAPTEAAATPEP